MENGKGGEVGTLVKQLLRFKLEMERKQIQQAFVRLDWESGVRDCRR